jgi:2-dehydropantoate 2-reductase
MGTGSLGTILGAYIAKAGKPIDLIDTYKDHVDALNKSGARVIGQADFTVPVTALTPDQMTGTYDLIFFMTKQTYNEEAIARLKPHIHDKTIIVTMQNGMPEPALVKEFGENRVMGCPVGWGATFKSPGVSELTSKIESLSFDLGRVDGRLTPEVDYIKQILECMCPVTVVTNLLGVRFTKIIVNATYSGMSAALASTYGDVMDGEKSFLCTQYIANECIKVAGAAGIALEPMWGFDFAKLLPFKTIAERDAQAPHYRQIWGPHRLLKASMLQDLEKGRKCEIGAINGVVCEMGDEHGIDTPVNDTVVDVVRKMEEGRLPLSPSNIDFFKIPDTI